ncbi:DUF2269 family protein [Egicoccus sp. AB-alg6-2]|uniref:DUF2269 family protein n=1 Tax=Egicoccus sp. AB-alg6-2 TaxID=3242692 RepID=UPI00359EEC2E
MSLYGFALFVHVVFAILLVGGSAFAHLTVGLMPRARTVDGLRAHVGWLRVMVKASGPFAGVVLVAGLYLAFAGNWWGHGWPVVSLVLFAMAGGAATVIVDPAVGRLYAALENATDGPVPADVRAATVDTTLTRATWVLGGADLAIVFLMTNKPGWAGALAIGAVGLALGALVGESQLRRHHRVLADALVADAAVADVALASTVGSDSPVEATIAPPPTPEPTA